jgi:hypothetical protein
MTAAVAIFAATMCQIEKVTMVSPEEATPSHRAFRDSHATRRSQPGHEQATAGQSGRETDCGENKDDRSPERHHRFVAQYCIRAGNGGRDHIDIAIRDHRQRKRRDRKVSAAKIEGNAA